MTINHMTEATPVNRRRSTPDERPPVDIPSQPHLPLEVFAPPEINLHDWDLVLLNTSAGKDSQTLINQVVKQAHRQGYPLTSMVAVHADLGRMEWPGTRQLAEAQAAHHGIEFHVVSRPQGDLLDEVRQRGRWPSPSVRYCTAHHKRGQIAKLITRLHRQRALPGQHFRLLNCLGFRSQESSARANRKPLESNRYLTTKSRTVWNWLPIHHWTEDQVWADIKASGVSYHPAYDLGMPRLSCVFCIFAPRSALLVAGKHNPALLQQYVDVENAIGHRFQHRQSIAEIQDAIDKGEDPSAMHGRWNM